MRRTSNIKSQFSLLTITITSLVLASCIISCTDLDVSGPSTPSLLFGLNEKLTVTIYGQVFDEDKEPVSGAEVSLISSHQSSPTLTDDKGYFQFATLENIGASAFLEIASPGKFKGFRRVSLLSDKEHYIEVMLMDKRINGSFDASAGGTVTHYSGARVTIDEGSVIRPDGTPYWGSVDVAMTWIDPSSEDLVRNMIGDLSGIDEDGIPWSLRSFGMMTVEIFDKEGSELNIHDQGASLNFPIPQQMQDAASNSIPLWYFDEAQGRWIEEGTAYREGDNYVGRVSHFSSFNVDHKSAAIEITGHAVWNLENEADPPSFLNIYVYNESLGISGGWLSGDGSFRFYNFPMNQVFELVIFGNCSKEVFRGTYGPYSENHDLGVLHLNDGEEIKTIPGKIVDCDGNALNNGRLIHRGRNWTRLVPFDEKGNFEFNYDPCITSRQSLIAIDFDKEKVRSISPIVPEDTVLLKNLVVCEDPDDFVLLFLGDEEPVFLYGGVYFSDYGFVTQSNDFLYVVDLIHSRQDTNSFSEMIMTIQTPLETLTHETVIQALRYTDPEIDVTHIENQPIKVIIDQYDDDSFGRISGTLEGSVLLSKTGEGDRVASIKGRFKVPLHY